MEMLGLALAFPAILVANFAYAAFVGLLLSKVVRLRQWLVWSARAILALVALDIVLVGTIGAVASRQALGPLYWILHLAGVFLGAPALANLLLIPGGRAWYHRWYLAAAICCIFGMFLVFFQVGVGDALFGPDGMGGPFAGQRAS